MPAIDGVYEVAIPVRNLARAETFYRGVLGLEIGLRDENRPWIFLRAGGLRGMAVLQESDGSWPAQHFAFTVSPAEIDRSVRELRDAGIEVQGPIVHDWVPAKSAYFEDPDGHALELCAPLERS